jgi:hypothetical protein
MPPDGGEHFVVSNVVNEYHACNYALPRGRIMIRLIDGLPDNAIGVEAVGEVRAVPRATNSMKINAPTAPIRARPMLRARTRHHTRVRRKPLDGM